jgi:hypothetical protein
MTKSFTSRNAEERSYSQLWTHKGNKFVIGTIHGEPIEIIAQYNPKELSRQVQAQWNDNPNTSAAQAKTSQTGVWAEYGTTRPRTLSVELVFDGYEEGISVAPIVYDLERLALPVDMSSSDPTKRRPPLCVAVWGTQQLRCVIESVGTKLSMFDLSGEPLRATCTIALKEVDVAAMLQVEANTRTARISQKGGGYVRTVVDHSRNPYPPEDSKVTKVPPYRQPPPDNTARPSEAAGSTTSKKQAPAAPIVTDATVYNRAPAKTVGTPSEQVDPDTIEGNDPNDPGSVNVFKSEKGNPTDLLTTDPA